MANTKVFTSAAWLAVLVIANLAAVQSASPPPRAPAPRSAPPASPPPPPPAAYVEYGYFYEGLMSLTTQTTTVEFLNETRLGVAIANLVNVTFLSPQNDAYLNLTKQPRGKMVSEMLAGKNGSLVLFNLLLFHVVTQYKDYNTLQSTTKGTGLPTLLNRPVFFSAQNGINYFFTNASSSSDNSSVVENDINPFSGIISVQGIDKVLIPLDPAVLLTPRPGLVPFDPNATVSPPPSPSLSPSSSPSPAPAPSPPPAPQGVPASAPTATTASPPPKSAASGLGRDLALLFAVVVAASCGVLL